GDDLRAIDTGGIGLFTGRKTVVSSFQFPVFRTSISYWQLGTGNWELTASLQNHGEESTGNGEAPDLGGESHPGAAGRDRARSARRQYHGLLQELQREDVEGRGAHHLRRRHRLPRTVVLLHHQDAAGVGAAEAGREPREGLRRAQQEQG